MKLSILMPVYNEEKTIDEIIERVKNIDYNDKEIIIVNDGSTDKTKEILSKFSSEDIKVINNVCPLNALLTRQHILLRSYP